MQWHDECVLRRASDDNPNDTYDEIVTALHVARFSWAISKLHGICSGILPISHACTSPQVELGMSILYTNDVKW